ncbi:MAG: ribonuclease Z [Conexivisphaera sp.]
MSYLEVTFLGTASASPGYGRRLPAAVLRSGDAYFVLDCGEGTQYSMQELGWKYVNKRMCVLASHMHGDHVLGIPGLLLSLSLQGRTREVHLLGPRGLRGFVLTALEYMRAGLTFGLEFHDVSDGFELDICGSRIRAALGRHTAPNYAYRLEFRRPGKFHPERAEALGVPKGPMWKALQGGSPVNASGRIVRPEDVMDPVEVRTSVAYSGDTRPTRRLVRFFSGADLLIHEATFSEADRRRAVENLHSTAREAGRVAARAGVRFLILTHFSNRYSDAGILLREATKEFERTYLAREGRTFALTPEGLLLRDQPLDH